MTRWTARGLAVRQLIAAAILGGLGLTGCGQKDAGAPAPATDSQPSAPADKPGARAVEAPVAPPPAPIVRDRLHQAFADATRGGDNPPLDSGKPVDQTDAGLSAYKVLTDVVKSWDTIRFRTPAGKKIHYTATLDTEHGKIVIELLPELAPNHVRNFVALARAGYYNELFFEQVRNERSEDKTKGAEDGLRTIEGGGPTGKTDPGNTSIGYWLKPEFQPAEAVAVRHAEGVVGACRGPEDDSAACRFYVSLTRAPSLDSIMTIFGKVVEGVEVVRTIYSQGAIVEDQIFGAHALEKPVVIRKVSIQTREE